MVNPDRIAAYLETLGRRRAEPGHQVARHGPGERPPASFAQRHLWLHPRIAPDQPVYNEPITIHHRGALDVAALERSLAEVLRRHEAWRTTFNVEDGELVQVVHE